MGFECVFALVGVTHRREAPSTEQEDAGGGQA